MGGRVSCVSMGCVSADRPFPSGSRSCCVVFGRNVCTANLAWVETGVQAVPPTRDASTQESVVVPVLRDMDAQTNPVVQRDAGVGTSALSRPCVVQDRRVVLSEVSNDHDEADAHVLRIVAQHELRTGFHVERERANDGATVSTIVLWDELQPRWRALLQEITHRFVEDETGTRLASAASLIAGELPRAMRRSSLTAPTAEQHTRARRASVTRYDSHAAAGGGGGGGGGGGRSLKEAAAAAASEHLKAPVRSRRKSVVLGQVDYERQIRVLAVAMDTRGFEEVVTMTLKADVDLLRPESFERAQREALAELVRENDALVARRLPGDGAGEGATDAELRTRATVKAMRRLPIFMVETYFPRSSVVKSQSMTFDQVVAGLRHPRLVRAAIQFAEEVGIRSVPLPPAEVRKLAYRPQDMTAARMLGHGKYSDWIPLAVESRVLDDGRRVRFSLRMRFRRTPFHPERAEALRDALSRDPTGLPFPLLASKASTHMWTRFVFEVTEVGSGALIQRLNLSYAELMMAHKWGVVDVADGLIAGMELAEAKLHASIADEAEELRRASDEAELTFLREIRPPRVMANRDEAANTIQDGVRRWLFRRKIRAVEELTRLIRISPDARDHARGVETEIMQPTNIRQWLMGSSPWTVGGVAAQQLTSKRRQFGHRGRVWTDSGTGSDLMQHPIALREPNQIDPTLPSRRLRDDLESMWEEQCLVRELDETLMHAGLHPQSRRKRREPLVQGFLPMSTAAALAGASSAEGGLSSEGAGSIGLPVREGVGASNLRVRDEAKRVLGDLEHALLDFGDPRFPARQFNPGSLHARSAAQAAPEPAAWTLPEHLRFAPIESLPERPSDWVSFLLDDLAFERFRYRWEEYQRQQSARSIPTGEILGLSIYDARPTRVALPPPSILRAETADRRTRDLAPIEDIRRRANLDSSLSGLARTLPPVSSATLLELGTADRAGSDDDGVRRSVSASYSTVRDFHAELELANRARGSDGVRAATISAETGTVLLSSPTRPSSSSSSSSSSAGEQGAALVDRRPDSSFGVYTREHGIHSRLQGLGTISPLERTLASRAPVTDAPKAVVDGLGYHGPWANGRTRRRA